MTNAERVVQVLRSSGAPLDDDELAHRCGISPRQQVNQICRRLETEGVLTRSPGADGKVVNRIADRPEQHCLCGCGEPARRTYRPGHDARHASQVGRELAAATDSSADQRDAILQRLPTELLRAKAVGIADRRAADARRAEQTAVVRTEPVAGSSSVPPALGSSHEQRDAERVMLDLLEQRVGSALSPRRLEHTSGAYVEVDGASADLSVLVECWAHQGPAKVAQKYKLVNDATKLAWIAKALAQKPRRLILCVSDELAVRHLRGRSWQGAAIRDLGVDIEVVALPREVADTIVAAQKRQYR